MLKILIVDDASFTRITLRRPLERESFSVVEAGTAEEGLELLVEQKPDLVITDYWLPGDDGITFFKKASAIHKVPFYLITHKAEVLDKAMTAGFAQALMKPIEFPALLALLRAQFPQSADPKTQVQQVALALEPAVYLAAAEAAKKDKLTVEQFIAGVLKQKVLPQSAQPRPTSSSTPAPATSTPAPPKKDAATPAPAAAPAVPMTAPTDPVPAAAN